MITRKEKKWPFRNEGNIMNDNKLLDFLIITLIVIIILLILLLFITLI